MKITINVDKIRAELLSPGHDGRQGRHCAPNRMSLTEVNALISRLHSGTFAECAARCNTNTKNLSTSLNRVRHKLGAIDDLELGFIAYERGYVTIDDERDG